MKFICRKTNLADNYWKVKIDRIIKRYFIATKISKRNPISILVKSI